MSGECDYCGEHCTDCRCHLKQKDGIKVWIQMFFEDGSVTKGLRMPAEWLDEGYEQFVERIALSLLEDVNRDEGWGLIWGAGNMIFRKYPTASSEGSDSSVSIL